MNNDWQFKIIKQKLLSYKILCVNFSLSLYKMIFIKTKQRKKQKYKNQIDIGNNLIYFYPSILINLKL